MAPEFTQGFAQIQGILTTIAPYFGVLVVVGFFTWFFSNR